MTNLKKLSKRGLALLLAFVMCLSMIQVSAFAADEQEHIHNADGWVCTQAESTQELACDKHVHEDSCFETQDTLVCELEEHTHGEGCYEAAEPVQVCEEDEHAHEAGCYDEEGALTCEAGEHTHDSSCFETQEGVLACASEEHTHGGDCYVSESVQVCPEEDHEHSEECYAVTEGAWTCAAPEAKDEAPEVPAEVQAFLDAVEAIPEITTENAAEVAEYLYGEVAGAYEALIGTEFEDRDDVQEAAAVYAAAIEAVDEALSLESDTYDASRTPNVTKSPYENYAPNNPAGSDLPVLSNGMASDMYGTVQLTGSQDSATDYLQVRYYTNHGGAYATGYTWLTSHSTNPNVASAKVTQSTLNGKPCLKVDFEPGSQEGTTTIEIGYTVVNLDNEHGIGTGNDFYMYVWGYVYYTVTNSGDSIVEKPDVPNKDNVTLPYVFIQCQDSGDETNHSAPANLFYAGETTIIPGEVVENSGENRNFTASSYPYQCDVELNGEFYVNLWNKSLEKTFGKHYLQSEPETIRFYYSASAGKWKCPTSSLTWFNSPDTGNAYGWLVKITKAAPLVPDAKTIPYTLVYAASPAEEGEVKNLPASEIKQGTAPGSVDFTVSSQVPTREGYTFAGWEVQNKVLKGGDTHTVTASANAVSVTEYLYATWTKNSEKPEAPVIPGKDGMLRVQVVCDSKDTGHSGEKENLRLRTPESNTGIVEYTAGEVVASEKDDYEWQCTVKLYKSDFATRFQHNSGGDHTYTAATKDTVDVTFYYKDGAWDYEKLRALNPGVEIVYEKNGSENYFCNYVVYHVEPKLPELPDAPTGDDLRALRLGVQVMCDVENSGHAVTEYLLKTGFYTVGKVTANTGDNKNQYPYICTVQLTTEQQNKYLTQSIKDSEAVWNEEHLLADSAKTLTATLYYDYDGEKWTLPTGGGMNPDVKPGTNITSWNYLVVHTTHGKAGDKFSIRVTKSRDSEDSVKHGSIVDYTVKVTNTSTASLWNLVIDDTMDPGLTLNNPESVTATTGGKAVTLKYLGETKLNDGKTKYSWEMTSPEEFKVGDTVTLTYSATVSNPTSGKPILHNVAHGAAYTSPENPEPQAAMALFANIPVIGAAGDRPQRPGGTVEGSGSLEVPTRGMVEDSSNANVSGGGEDGGDKPGSSVEVLPTYTVTYIWSGLPEGAAVTLPTDSRRYSEGDAVTVDTTYTKDQEITVDGKTYVFSGWSTDDFTMPAGDVTISGSWTEKEADKFTVTYSWTGLPEGTTDPAAPAAASYEEGDTVTVDTRASGSEVTVNGRTYVFSGWDRTGSFEMPAGNVTITGTWSEKQYRVTYSWTGLPEGAAETLPNGGMYVEGALVNVDSMYTNGRTATVNGRTYVFSGWNRTGSFEMPGSDVTISGTWTVQSGGGSDVPTPSPSPSPTTPVDPRPSTPVDPDDGDDDPPTRPVNPVTPVNPDGGDDDGTPDVPPVTPDTPDVNIPEEDVPLVNVPDVDVPLAGTPEVDVPDADVPLTGVPEEVVIPDVDVPLADTPDVPVMDIPVADVPMGNVPAADVVDIPNANVPLADVPKTGDDSRIWTLFALISGLGLAWLMLDKKREAIEK